MRHVHDLALSVVVLAALSSACASRAAPPPTLEPAGVEGLAMAALDVDDDDVYIRIVDVGPGLCAVVTVPGGHAMVYDAGHWNGQHCVRVVRELVTAEMINLMIISHSDADHLGDGARILSEKRVLHTILAGEPRETASWSNFMTALSGQVEEGGSVLNLQTAPLVPGATVPLGEAVVTLVAGWGRWEGAGPTESERRNAISIVARLEYRGRSVLFTGDTVGRRLNDPDDACKDAEAIMVDRHHAGEVSLKADVLVAGHHGANNASTTCFIEAVDPQFVVFSAGHDHEHPTSGTADRFLAHGVPIDHLFRTDFGDDEPGSFEWKEHRIPGCSDPAGDDDVEIALRADGTVEVDYFRSPVGCDSRDDS